jgi:signal transduction histidine kinase
MTTTAEDDASTAGDAATASLFAGPGEMRARCRDFDWSATQLGPVNAWSQSLRTIVSTLLASRHPMFLWWGPKFVQIYNDGYRPSFGEGGRHPTALGAEGPAFWTDIWGVIGPDVDGVRRTGEATWHEDQLVPIERNGRTEDVWWTYSYSAVRDDDGTVAGVLVVVQETTRRVKLLAERQRLLNALEVESARLMEVFRRAPSFIVAFRGPELRYEFVNEAYYQLVGHRDILGKPLFEALPEMRDQGFAELLTAVRETGEPWVGRETPVLLQRLSGAPLETRYLDMVFQPLVDPDGSRSGVVAHGSDVTEQVVARRDVERLLAESEAARADAERARRDAEAANRAKSDFLAVMSHELRTPLNAIGGYTELLEMGIHGPITEAQRASLNRIQQSQRHLLGLINEVLNHTRIEAGGLRYTLEDVALDTALVAASALIMPQLTAKGLAYNLDECAPSPLATADPEKLRQILLNLLTNAIKFTPSGGRISVSCGVKGEAAEIAVADTGIGVPPDKLASIFEPFVQVNQLLTRPHEGVGLGLAISRELARGMGGDLTASSTPGKGSVFTLTLPLARVQDDAPAAHAVRQARPAQPSGGVSSRPTADQRELGGHVR